MVEIQGPAGEGKSAGQKGGMLKLKIAKKAYVFDVRKKYTVSRNFALKKKAETPAEDLKQRLQELFAKKKQQHPQQGAAPAEPAKQSGQGSKFTLIKSMAIALILVVLAGAAFVGFLMLGSTSVPPSADRPDVFSGNYSFSVDSTEMVSVLDRDVPSRAAYFLAKY
ncbi:Uncharacterised protein [uncultured archaeon]|nr:Uncharacterised protein [uncultured archaeon]